jgi:hypothetical membrane protein
MTDTHHPASLDPRALGVPRWALFSAAGAPVLLIGGWTIAATLQPSGYDPIVDTISDLAALTAVDRWLMTGVFVGVGLCHVTTAWGLLPARRLGRAALALGGLATIGVAATPITATATPIGHTLTAGTAFLALTLWPVLASRGSLPTPQLLRLPISIAATGVLAVALVWFGAELSAGGTHLGLAERVAAGAQSLWPLAVVVGCRWAARSRMRRTDAAPPG